MKEKVEHLVNNALDFLKRAVLEVESHPKHSVINFHTAVELLLKARLLAEHWTLIVVRKDREPPKLKKFEDGDFQSASFEYLVSCLNFTLNDPISKEEHQSLEKIRQHRNRIVHFYSVELNSEREVGIIIAEQVKAWYYLENIIGRWRKYIGLNLQTDIQIGVIRSQMLKNKTFLTTKFELLSEKIAAEQEKGNEVSVCPSCSFNSCILNYDVGILKKGKCLLCEFQEEFLEITCPHCDNATLVFQGFDGDKCSLCSEYITTKEIKGHLDSILPSRPDEYDDKTANCCDCGGYQAVRKIDANFWVCSQCITLHIDPSIHKCDWCSEYYAGDEIEDTHFVGCGIACRGHMGHHLDQDD